MSLADQRAHLTAETHFRDLDRDIEDIREDVVVAKTLAETRLTEMERRLEKLLWTVIGATISAGTAILLLALNLVVGA